MDSGQRKAAAVQAGWADLPPELLRTISVRLQNTSEIFGFRSVCRSWRSSTVPPPNKLSPLFPLKFPFPFSSGKSFFDCSHLINVSALYLVRPRSDPSKAWVVSVQESAAGKLVLRHALTHQEINSDAELDLDENRIVATQSPIAGFYAHNHLCKQCNGVKFTRKVLFVSKMSSGCSQLVGLCSFPQCGVLVGICSCPEIIPFAFRLELGGGGLEATRLSDEYVESIHSHLIFQDSVKFNGWIFVVDWQGYISVLDHMNLQLVRVIEKPVREDIGDRGRIKFVLSDGDLYVVWLSNGDPEACEIYRLVVVTDGNECDSKCSGMLIEQVQNLGERVFFVAYQCSFSISARLLPHPWQEGNYVFVSDFPDFSCRCARHEVQYSVSVFHLGSQTFTRFWTEDGHPYADLFTPPVSFKVEEPRHSCLGKPNNETMLEMIVNC